MRLNNEFYSNGYVDKSKLKKYKNAAVVTDNYYSSQVAKSLYLIIKDCHFFLFTYFITIRDILNANGSAVDSAIAAAITNSVIHSHHHGIGGGCVMVINLK